jgi:hypothetical protein
MKHPGILRKFSDSLISIGLNDSGVLIVTRMIEASII